MMPPQRVVFDCNVYFQAFLSETGPAGRLLAGDVCFSVRAVAKCQ